MQRTIYLSAVIAPLIAVGLGWSAAHAQTAFDPAAPAGIAARMSWHVANPFRLFKDAKQSDVHRATYLALDENQRKSPVLSAERALSERHTDGWAATMYKDVCWNAVKNRYECKSKGDYINPESHEVIVTLDGIDDPGVDCTWLTAPVGRGRGTSVTQKCSEEAEFDIPYPDGVSISVEIGGREIAKADIKVRDILVAAMGDSFGSGEGNPDVPVRLSRERTAEYGKAGKDPLISGLPARVGAWKRIGDSAFQSENAQWIDQACHRSLYSHQMRAALQLAVEDPHRAVTFAGVACSGAEITFGLFLRYKGNEWVPNPPDLSQIAALADAQCGDKEAAQIDMPEAYHMKGVIPELQGGLVLRKCAKDNARKIDLMLVSVGGNDVGFARLVANAVLADQSVTKTLGGWFGQVHGNMQSQNLLTRLDERYKALNRALHGILHMPWEESDRIVLTAYPPLALIGDGRNVCPDGNAGMDVYGDLSLSQKRARDSSVLADKLQRVMAKSAKTHAWSFADTHRGTFVGRGVCAGFTDSAFSVADDLRIPRKVDGNWAPYNPADFKAYAPRQRWFRTPNDAFMTGNFHTAASVTTRAALALQSLQKFQILLAATYSGAFHPTAEGHAAIADSVAARARSVLKKYGQQSDAAVTP